MNEPELLIMDEPSAGLDPLIQSEFHQMLQEVAAEGGTVFLSSHTLSEVQQVADRVGIIRRGRLVALESLAELRSKAMRKIDIQFCRPGRRRTGSAGSTACGSVTLPAIARPFRSTAGWLICSRCLAAGDHVLDIATREADLEEIFLTYYRDDDPAD